MANRTLLLVEDDVISMEAMAVVLQKEGYRVVPFPEAGAALEYLRGNSAPHLILLDMVIPGGGCDGWWFLERRKAVPNLARIPVIVTTALSVASEEWLASLGAQGYLRKPIEANRLLTAVEGWLAGPVPAEGA